MPHAGHHHEKMGRNLLLLELATQPQATTRLTAVAQCTSNGARMAQGKGGHKTGLLGTTDECGPATGTRSAAKQCSHSHKMHMVAGPCWRASGSISFGHHGATVLSNGRRVCCHRSLRHN